MSSSTSTLGLITYIWGPAHQDRMLVECLAPAITALRRQGFAHRFWLDRHDARGPHVFAVVTIPHESAPDITRDLTERITHHLAVHPSKMVLTFEQLARRHQETRQRWQCVADGRPGFAPNNSFESFEHPCSGYPFSLSSDLSGAEELWELVADLPLWAVGQLIDRPGVPALGAARRWVASLQRELCLAGVPCGAYWLYHVTTLLPDFFAGMQAEEKEAAMYELGAHLDADRAFAQSWQAAIKTSTAWPELPRMLRLILGDCSAPSPPWHLLREIDHTVLKLLGVPVALHLPMALYAWRRSLEGT